MSALIAYRNLADSAVLSTTGGAPLAGFPLTNLQTRQLARVCRLPYSGAAKLVVDLGAATRIDIVALLGINTVARGDNALTVEYSANGTVWSAATAAIAGDQGAPDLPRGVIVRVRQPGVLTKLTTRWLRITPAWGVSGGGYYEIGRLWASDSLDIPEGCDAGWSLANHDYGALDRSAGLQVYADRRTRGRVLSMPMTGIDTAIAYGFAETATTGPDNPSLDDLINYAGSTGEVIVAPRADSPLWLRRTGLYGHLTPESLRIQHRAGPNYECTLTVEEER